jgi:hypothetical protein
MGRELLLWTKNFEGSCNGKNGWFFKEKCRDLLLERLSGRRNAPQNNGIMFFSRKYQESFKRTHERSLNPGVKFSKKSGTVPRSF